MQRAPQQRPGDYGDFYQRYTMEKMQGRDWVNTNDNSWDFAHHAHVWDCEFDAKNRDGTWNRKQWICLLVLGPTSAYETFVLHGPG